MINTVQHRYSHGYTWALLAICVYANVIICNGMEYAGHYLSLASLDPLYIYA